MRVIVKGKLSIFTSWSKQFDQPGFRKILQRVAFVSLQLLSFRCPVIQVTIVFLIIRFSCILFVLFVGEYIWRFFLFLFSIKICSPSVYMWLLSLLTIQVAHWHWMVGNILYLSDQYLLIVSQLRNCILQSLHLALFHFPPWLLRCEFFFYF